jgi:ABC-type lipoprotein release transport system permease subunit
MLLRMAFRNLFRNKRRTLITMTAIAVGMALIDVTITIQHGSYTDLINRGVSSIAGHVVVRSPGFLDDPELRVTDSAAHAKRLASVSPDAVVQRRIMLGGLLSSTSGSAAVQSVAVEPAISRDIGSMYDEMVSGDWLETDRDIIIGARLAETLDVKEGDKLVFMGQSDGEMTSRLFRLKGVFKTGAADVDGFMVVMPFAAGQEILGGDDLATMVTLHLDDAAAWPQAVDAAQTAFDGTDVDVLSWKGALPDVDAFIKADRSIGQGMLFALFIIVSMGVFNTFLMSVLERTREFGVLQSIGMKPNQIAKLVLVEGALLGFFGVCMGSLLGVGLSYPIVVNGLDFTESMGEGMSNAGVVMSTIVYGAWDIPRMLVFGFACFVVTFLAAIWPAWKVSRLEPVKALRNQG